MKKFDMQGFVKDLSKNEFVKSCGIPLGYKASYPIIKCMDGEVLLTFPYKKTVRTKDLDVCAVFPVEYTITFALHAVKEIPASFKVADKEAGFSNASLAGFEILRYSKKFEKVDFNQPVDVFPHEDIRVLGKEEYKERVTKLYATYDAIINDALDIEKAAGIDRVEFKQLLSTLIAPVTKQLYKFIDEDFYTAYLA